MIFVFLPAYNEEEALPKLISKLDQEFKNIGQSYRTVVLDDGSQDGTKKVARDLSVRYTLTLIEHSLNQGLGPTMVDGLKHVSSQAAPGDAIVTLDCDDAHEPKYIGKALDKMKEGYDLVILSRYQAGGGERGLSFIKSVLSRGAGFFLKIFFRSTG